MVCEKVRRNLTIEEWYQFVGFDIPYERTCPNLPLHPSFIEGGQNLAKEGDLDGAVEIFKKALTLHPGLDLEPQAEATKWKAQGLIEKGRELAKEGNVDDAIAIFQQALEIEPRIEINPAEEVNTWMAQGLVEKGKRLARSGYVDSAILSFQKALEFDSSLDLNPEAEAQRLAAPVLVGKGQRLALEGNVKEAIVAYTEAQTLDPRLHISAGSWNFLCWSGSLWEHAVDVMEACEKAVTLDPENGNIRDNRGLARAMTGDIDGAIEDFQAYVDWTDNEERKAKRQRWIEALQAGENPFTPELLEELWNE
jgi:tetratricopeptide (TPR) repeat protein